VIDGDYRLRLENRLQETQHTNLVELIIYDHPPNQEVFLDRRGVPHSVGDLALPKTAVTESRTSVLEALSSTDNRSATPDLGQDDGKQSLYLSFERPNSAERAKLVVSARTSFWLDYTFYRFQELFGEKYERWQAVQKDRTAKELQDWKLEQGIPLMVYVKKNGKWIFVDYFDETGPLRSRRNVMEIDISGLPEGDLELKLESGFLFWEIDSVGIDYTPDTVSSGAVASPKAGKDRSARLAARLLADDDRAYHTLHNTGDSLDLEFAAPPKVEGAKRSVFLHSKGYYQIIRQFSGKPDRAKLEGFREPLALPTLGREIFQEISR